MFSGLDVELLRAQRHIKSAVRDVPDRTEEQELSTTISVPCEMKSEPLRHPSAWVNLEDMFKTRTPYACVTMHYKCLSNHKRDPGNTQNILEILSKYILTPANLTNHNTTLFMWHSCFVDELIP